MTEVQTKSPSAADVAIRRPTSDLVSELSNLASKITAGLDAMQNASKDIVQRAIAVGENLIVAKAKVPHGQWLSWLKDKCTLEERTAQRYMKLAEGKAMLLSRSDKLSDLTLAAAQQLLDGEPAQSSATSSKTSLPVSTQTVDGYDSVEKKLIKKLEKMTPEDAEASAQGTINELTKMVKAKKGGKTSLKIAA